jgi:hypothetical protein
MGRKKGPSCRSWMVKGGYLEGGLAFEFHLPALVIDGHLEMA